MPGDRADAREKSRQDDAATAFELPAGDSSSRPDASRHGDRDKGRARPRSPKRSGGATDSRRRREAAARPTSHSTRHGSAPAARSKNGRKRREPKRSRRPPRPRKKQRTKHRKERRECKKPGQEPTSASASPRLARGPRDTQQNFPFFSTRIQRRRARGRQHAQILSPAARRRPRRRKRREAEEDFGQRD